MYHFSDSNYTGLTHCILLQSQGMAKASVTNLNTPCAVIQCLQLLSCQVENENDCWPVPIPQLAIQMQLKIDNETWSRSLFPDRQTRTDNIFLQQFHHVDTDHIMNSCLNKSFSPLIIHQQNCNNYKKSQHPQISCHLGSKRWHPLTTVQCLTSQIPFPAPFSHPSPH